MKQLKLKFSPYYLTPALLAILIFGSNFLNTNLFTTEQTNFTVWFVLSLFSFACGWLIDKTLGWNYGGKIVFAVTVATTFISLVLILLFSNYFNLNNLMTESLFLFSLRNITLGAMGFFGMAVAEVLILQKKNVVDLQKGIEKEEAIRNAERLADLTVKEAKLEADKIILEAEKESVELIQRKKMIKSQLREFIQTERELLRSYEEEDKE